MGPAGSTSPQQAISPPNTPDPMTETPQTPQPKHTPEPWDDASQYPGFKSIRIFAKTHFIATVGNTDDTKAQTEANAARIVTCVNALAGIPDPAATLKAVREALAITKREVECYCTSEGVGVKPGHGFPCAHCMASAALAALPPTTEARP